MLKLLMVIFLASYLKSKLLYAEFKSFMQLLFKTKEKWFYYEFIPDE